MRDKRGDTEFDHVAENLWLRLEAVKFEAERIREFVAALPFKLTNAQRLAAWEIFQDMERGTPMNRLLQGDVGAGKTVVAALAAYEAVTGTQHTSALGTGSCAPVVTGLRPLIPRPLPPEALGQSMPEPTLPMAVAVQKRLGIHRFPAFGLDAVNRE